MPAVPIQVDGFLFDLLNKTTQRVVLQGSASISGLEVGGGPIYPPAQPPGGGGSPPQPIHPIWGPPGFNPPGPGMPPGIWGGPIVPPDVPPDSGTSPAGDKPPPAGGGWGYVSSLDGTWGWGYFPQPAAGGKPMPPGTAAQPTGAPRR